VRRIGPLLALGVLALSFALTPSVALAKKHKVKHIPPAEQQVLNDCNNHNRLTRHYPLKVLQQAYNDLSSDLAEYSLCAQEIHDAELAYAAGNKAPPKANNAQRARAAKKASKQLQQAAADGGAPVDLAGEKIAAGAVGANGSSLLGTLPTPLLIVLILLLALAGVPAAEAIRRYVRARRQR
jgi:hypothetical protein